MPVNDLFRNASYQTSAHRIAQLPPDGGAEVAFAGRSNAGKSSLLNCVCERRGLARTSRTPGRTQQIVCFDLGQQKRLVDLPGWGFARVPATLTAHWLRTLPRYLQQRSSLKGLVMVMDSRRVPGDEERQVVDWGRQWAVPVLVALNKEDKLGQGERQRVLARTREWLGDDQDVVRWLLLSALRGSGVAELRGVLAGWLDTAGG